MSDDSPSPLYLTVLNVWAHPEPQSLTCAFANFATRNAPTPSVCQWLLSLVMHDITVP